jgi:hypothetical protein
MSIFGHYRFRKWLSQPEIVFMEQIAVPFMINQGKGLMIIGIWYVHPNSHGTPLLNGPISFMGSYLPISL